jgi:hypothetical protein
MECHGVAWHGLDGNEVERMSARLGSPSPARKEADPQCPRAGRNSGHIPEGHWTPALTLAQSVSGLDHRHRPDACPSLAGSEQPIRDQFRLPHALNHLFHTPVQSPFPPPPIASTITPTITPSRLAPSRCRGVRPSRVRCDYSHFLCSGSHPSHLGTTRRRPGRPLELPGQKGGTSLPTPAVRETPKPRHPPCAINPALTPSTVRREYSPSRPLSSRPVPSRAVLSCPVPSLPVPS